MSTNHTENYNLNQWEPGDKVLRAEFNEDNARIDAALKAEADARTALSKKLSGFGNCRMWTHSYVGTGTSGPDNPTVVNFYGHPDFFIIYGGQGVMFGTYGGVATLISTNRSVVSYLIPPNWSGNRFSFSVSDPYPQLNVEGFTYYVVEFYEVG